MSQYLKVLNPGNKLLNYFLISYLDKYTFIVTWYHKVGDLPPSHLTAGFVDSPDGLDKLSSPPHAFEQLSLAPEGTHIRDTSILLRPDSGNWAMKALDADWRPWSGNSEARVLASWSNR